MSGRLGLELARPLAGQDPQGDGGQDDAEHDAERQADPPGDRHEERDEEGAEDDRDDAQDEPLPCTQRQVGALDEAPSSGSSTRACP